MHDVHDLPRLAVRAEIRGKTGLLKAFKPYQRPRRPIHLLELYFSA